jgi:DNA topoisomerase III
MPKTVIIAEKTAVAKEIASFLVRRHGGRLQVEEGGYRLPNGDFVTYTNGHMIELMPMDAYLTPAQLDQDPMEYLPVFPGPHKRVPRAGRKSDGTLLASDLGPIPDPLFKVIEREVRAADVIVNAGDIGREGQLVMDALFIHLGLDPCSPKILRAILVDMHESALARAFDNLMPNGDVRWQNSGAASKARQEADWELGINASRAYQSLLGDRSVAVGRLKGVILWMVAQRERVIAKFHPVKYYTPVITLDDGTELRWKARPGAENTPGFDGEGRIISEEVAKAIVDKINAGLAGRYTKAGSRRIRRAAPLPFTKTTLEVDACRKLGIPMEDVTEAMTNLYLKHKLISYIGTDCPYIPETMLKDARNIMAGLSPMFGKTMRGANASMHPDSIDDSKIGQNEHHAIVPLGVLPATSKDLTDAERAVFEMISNRFAAQFYPDFEFDATSVEVAFGDDLFGAQSTQVVSNGWTNADTRSPDMTMDEDSSVSDLAPAEDEHPDQEEHFA